MARLGPWDRERRVAVAVSGGPDSLALAVLAQDWGTPSAYIVDHDLRPGSAAEAEAARAALAARGMPAEVLTLHGVRHGPGLAARARVARYAALAAACRAAGLVDVLLGHHAGDQAETVLMRRRRGSRAAGLAGMAAVTETDDVRLVRPLLGVLPETLRAVVDQAGLVPAEDPSNTDPGSTRAQLRREIGTERGPLLAEAAQAARLRREAEIVTARELAATACLYPEGYATLLPMAGAAGYAALLRSLSGRRYPVPAPGAAEAGTRAGVLVQKAGRAGDGWLLTREPGATAPPVACVPGAVWDGRFRVAGWPGGGEIGTLGADASRLRRHSSLPSAVLRTLPALRYDGVLCAAPHLGYGACDTEAAGLLLHSARYPASGAPFLAG